MIYFKCNREVVRKGFKLMSPYVLLSLLITPLHLLATESEEILTPGKSITYPWKQNIVTTVFWIGQGSTSYSSTTNYKSAWDTEWKQNYGGLDDPARRNGLLPKKFAATLNPFYVALPFNDLKYPDLAKKYIPWYKKPSPSERWVSQCKGRWIQIRNRNGKSAYGQWEDVGPIRTDLAKYVFGNARPKEFNGAGLDVSPAIQRYLGLSGLEKTDWRFVEACDVPPGPWTTYGEQAILFSVIKKQEEESARRYSASNKPELSKSRKNPSDG